MSDFDRWLERTPEDDPERDERQSFLDALDDSEQTDVEEAVLRAEARMLDEVYGVLSEREDESRQDAERFDGMS